MGTRLFIHSLCAAGFFGLSGVAGAAAGDPLPKCAVKTQGFYAFNISGDTGTSDIGVAQLVTLKPGGATVDTQVIYGEGSASTAVGMNPTNGYLYGVQKPAGLPTSNLDYLNIIKYGSSGFENLGVIQGMPAGYDRYPYFSSADFAPDGTFYIAKFFVDQSVPAGSHAELIKISLVGDVPTYIQTIALTPPIGDASAPGATPKFGDVSQDFAIDATGQYAYGLIEKYDPALAGGTGRVDAYRIELATGAVTFVQNFAKPREFSYQGTARLPNGDYAVSGKNGDYRLMSSMIPLDAKATFPGGFDGSGDAASCIAQPDPSVGATPVPTLSATMLVMLSGLLGAAAFWRRRRPAN